MRLVQPSRVVYLTLTAIIKFLNIKLRLTTICNKKESFAQYTPCVSHLSTLGPSAVGESQMSPTTVRLLATQCFQAS